MRTYENNWKSWFVIECTLFEQLSGRIKCKHEKQTIIKLVMRHIPQK